MDLNRRGFLKGAAGVGALAAIGGLAGCATSAANDSAEGQNAAESSSASWRVAPEPITDISSTMEADFIIVGAGNTGMCAATTAIENGASVIVLEQFDTPQNSRSWLGAINSSLQRQMGYTADPVEVTNDICRYSNYLGNQRLISLWANRSGEFVDWWRSIIEPLGADTILETKCDDYKYMNIPTAHHLVAAPKKLEGNQLYVANVLLLPYLQGKGVDFHFTTTADYLVQEDSGKVTGVIGTDADGKHIQFNAKKLVVVACGGFAGNQDMMDDLVETGHRYCSFGMDIVRPLGRGMQMLYWAGAQLAPVQETMIFDRGTVPDGATVGGMPFQGGIWYGGSLPFLRVNVEGERFFNEDQLYDWNWNAAISQPTHTWWQVFDGKFYQDATKFQNTRCARIVSDPDGGAPNTAWIDGKSPLDEDFIMAQLNDVITTTAGKKADTLDALAQQMGVDKTTFLATVKRYNELAASGVDNDFGKEGYRLSTLEQGPYYAVHCAGWILCTIGGVNTDLDLHPVDADGNPIEGLIAAGNEVGNFYTTTYPETYGGLNMGRNLTLVWYAIRRALGIE